MDKEIRDLRKEFNLVTPAEILAYENIIFSIDKDILNMMLQNNRVDLEANYHRELLEKAKAKFELSEEAIRAIEGFYDVYFGNVFLLSQTTDESINLVELFNSTMYELQEIVTKEMEEWAKENNIRVIKPKYM